MLTQMATLSMLVQDGILIRVTVPLARGKFHERLLYATPGCVAWMRDEVPKMVSGRLQSDTSPRDQLATLLRQWMSGDPMRMGSMFSELSPTKDRVWKMKTADLRIFGWLCEPRKFVAVLGGYADDYKEPTKTRLYGDARRDVVAFRGALPLDGAKFADGDFDDLV